MSTSLIQEVESALYLARYEPTGERADQLRARLRERIEEFIEPASRYVDALPDNRARDVATSTVTYAGRLVTMAGPFDPVAELRLLAGSAEAVSVYAAPRDRTPRMRE
ncbi:DUF6415 family natural product biosynthesis protein [Streptomyces monticola]|uniref:DUF6415 family natural product biosynthesis protein n=1 Tax=Streptomyces monticola TaxID=2666263 RepID=A0ABW2J9Z0_9ACTN